MAGIPTPAGMLLDSAGSAIIDVVLGLNVEAISDVRNLRPGDHIEAVGDGYTYYHHGIFLGHDQGRNNVAEVVNEETAPRYTNLNSFTVNGTKPLYRINYRQCDPAAQVVSRAKHFVAHPEKWGPYNLLSHNCEHFATYCKTGKAMSLQLLKKIKSFAFGGFLAALWPNK